ncbi:MAG TPA: ATP12 family protein [Allosphingosinicella sp.]|nr:ATP12 family protein [Allosphingosinicella sp.]
MKRFYKDATIVASGSGGWSILLDGRPVRTPARNPLELPTEALAEAVAGEWRAQGDKVDPRSMPLTGLANAAIDRAAPDVETFARSLALFGESDLLCYRADGPRPLAERQAEAWDPLLTWARRRFDSEFEVTEGIVHRAQPRSTLDRLHRAVAARDPFALAAMSPLVTISGSLIIALALAEGEIGLDEAWAAATIDESWQSENWGEDDLATAALEARRVEFEAAWRFLSLLQPRS